MFNRNFAKLAGVGAIAVTIALGGPAKADLVANGGFETGDFSGWTLGGNTGFTSVSSELPHSGTYSAKLGAVGSDTVLSQILATTPGTLYDLTFWLENDGGTPNDFSASFDGVTLTHLINAPAFAYTEFTYDVLATSASTALVFDVRQDPSYFHLDDVSVVQLAATPLPAALPLFAGGLGLVGFLARRRKRKGAVAIA